MKNRLLIVLAVVASTFLQSASGQVSTPPSYDGETRTISIDLTASGMRTAQKLDDTTCAFGFPGLVENPTADVLTSDGAIVTSTPLGIGEWSKPDETALCKVTLEIEVPVDQDFNLNIAPYYSESISQSQIESGTLVLEIDRKEGDSFPISPIPTGGPIENTEDIRIVGTFELRGEDFDDFMNGPFGCMGMGGYSDIQAGMQITVRNEEDKIIGVAELLPDPIEDMPDDCQFYFVADVPVSEFYTFESGRRGSLTFSHDDIENDGWSVQLSIG